MVSPQQHVAAMERINALVNVRERNVQEVQERLRRYGFTDEEVEDAVETALRVNLINEERYARAFIKGKTRSGWGRMKIVQRLRACNIPEHVIDECASEFNTAQEEYERALHELAKRRATSKDPYATYMRRLIGKGFSYDVSQRAVREHLSFQ